MKNHVLRPLWLAIGLVVLLLTARHFMVPKDFGVHGDSFTYNFYRLGNVEDWKAFPVKYRGRERCSRCHDENYQSIMVSKHKIIQCENCHGPGNDHPRKVKKLVIDTSRGLCLRCHAKFDYPDSNRGKLKGIISEEHRPKSACIKCHNPHDPNLEDM